MVRYIRLYIHLYIGGIDLKVKIIRIIAIVVVVVLVLLQTLEVFAIDASNFKDIQGNWAQTQIYDLIKLGVIDGYGDNTIQPNNLITRAEFSSMVAKAIDIQVDTNDTNVYFRDVKPGDWYYGVINSLKKSGIIGGYDDQTFKPGKNITRSEMTKMLVGISKGKLKLTFDTKLYRDVPLSHWAYWDIGTATRAGIVVSNGVIFKPDESVTRAEVAYSIDKMLWNQKSDDSTSTQDLINFINGYSGQISFKYNNMNSDMTDLINMSYGGQVDKLNTLNQKLLLYKNMGVRYDRTMNLSNIKVSALSSGLARVDSNYDLVSKMFIGRNTNTISQSGLLTYLLQKVNDSWLVYGEDEEIIPVEIPQQVGKINLVWDYVGQSSVDKFKEGVISGLDILSPTWYDVADKNGNLISRANANYVQWAHDNGYTVWPLITNAFDPKLTSEVLGSTTSRQKLINNILQNVDTYKFDGINIDFENIYKADKDLFTQFINELARSLKSRGVLLSVDVTINVPGSSWSDGYDRAAIAKAADYVAVMTYDQHWATSPQSGSVAQLSWVENGVQKILKEIPREKLLLGLPFYTREWKEVYTANGIIVSSKAISMATAKKRITDNNVKMVWDAVSGQYFAQYSKDGATYKIWLEDARSIDLKSQLVNKYGLAGVASWQAGFETSDIWEVIKKNLGK